jgi:hypothetical protein
MTGARQRNKTARRMIRDVSPINVVCLGRNINLLNIVIQIATARSKSVYIYMKTYKRITTNFPGITGDNENF